ncbi:hypothetical protein ABZ297_19900 [Nonomuraea sp. NPDC005983]|uniref:hypothetical protein n=1 Tax=Nonomuraea sp. NPDC005983 TaxID=3155595 RepID=UPI0033AAC406
MIKTGDLLTYVNKEDVGDVTLMWSRTCKAAWGVIKVSPRATGAILLATDLKEKGKTSYRRYTAGKGGRHWGPMLAVAPREMRVRLGRGVDRPHREGLRAWADRDGVPGSTR